MKTVYFKRIGCVTSLLWFVCGMIYSQKHDLKTEVLVFIMADSLEFPAKEKGELSLHLVDIRSSSLATTLERSKATRIAKAFPNWSNNDSIVTRLDGEKVQIPPFHRIFKLSFETETMADSAIALLEQSSAVVFAEKNSDPKLDNDPEYINGTQWYLNNDGRNDGIAGADINIEEAWAMYTGSSSNKIAIIDTGVELTHEDLSGKATGETHFGNAHGTMVAGIAAARANNALGIRGVDWNAQIISKRIRNEYDEYIGDSEVAQKITDAVDEGSTVLNCSWSGPTYSTTLALAFAYTYKMNRIAVATMGNTGLVETRYPGALLNVIAVGATQNNDIVSLFSTRGAHIDVVGTGGGGLNYPIYDESDMLSTTINNDYDFNAGTSFAAPQVTGLASLLKGYRPNLSNDDVRQIIRLSADDRGNPGFDNSYGYGRINAGHAFQLLQEPNEVKQWTSTGGSSVSVTSNYTMVFIGASGLASSAYIVKRHEVQKSISFPQSFCQIIGAWGRGVSTSGWSQGSPNFGEGFCEIVPGTLTPTGVTLRTYVYQVYSYSGSYLGYYPSSPTNVTFAYSVLGIPEPTELAGPITGPSIVCSPGVFTVQNLPSGCSITWNPGPYLTMTSQQGSNPCTFTANGSGASWVEATITDSLCGSTTLPKFYVQANPVYNFISTEYDKDCSTVTLATNLPSYTSVTWNASSNFLIDGYYPPLSKQDNSIIVTSTDGNGGSVYGTTSLGCSITPFTTFCPCQSWSGASITWIWACPSPGEPLIAEVSPLHPDATEYKWYIGDQLIETTYDGYLQTYNWPCTSEMPHLYVTGVTSCGHTELIDGGEFFPACGGYKSSSNIILYPNPASSEVTIALEEKQSPVILISSEIQINTLSEITQIKLIDKTGMTRKLMNFGKNTTKVSLQLSEFQSGVYYLDVTDGARHVIKPLTIKK